MLQKKYDIIVIGAGSGGLSVGLFMGKAGFKVLMVAKTDKDIGGECLNDGCVPSKALIHISKIIYNAKLSNELGLQINGGVDVQKVIDYVYKNQQAIREHENSKWLQEQGIDVALGEARFLGKNQILVNGERFNAKKIVLATGSKPKKLKIPGVELVEYFDNENVFRINHLPKHLLVAGSGSIGIEIAQAMGRLGSKVTVIESGNRILNHDDETITDILLKQLQQEKIKFHFNFSIKKFVSANEAIIEDENGNTFIENFDAIFVAIGRELSLEPLQLNNAGVDIKNNKIVKDRQLRTTNKDIFVCGDVAGDLLLSQAAELHARIIINNLISPIKKKLSNDHMSWVTFTDPELATFGLNEKQLKNRGVNYIKLEETFEDDDRAVVDNYRYGKMILFINKKSWFKKQRILGGSMIAPHAGELIQELILANASNLSIEAIFNKIYPYPVASRVNQRVIAHYMQQRLTGFIKKLLHTAFKIFG